MKFSCDRCHRRFSTTDEPVPGRVYRVGCRCGHVIVLRPVDATEPLSPPLRVVPRLPATPPRRSVPPPLPRGRHHPTEPPRVRQAPETSGPAPAVAPAPPVPAPRPPLAVLATTPTPVPLPDDGYAPVRSVDRARARVERLLEATRSSLAARLGAWRSGRIRGHAIRGALDALRSHRTGWDTLLVSCAASACVAAFVTGWLMTGSPRPHAVPRSRLAPEAAPAVAVTPPADAAREAQPASPAVAARAAPAPARPPARVAPAFSEARVAAEPRRVVRASAAPAARALPASEDPPRARAEAAAAREAAVNGTKGETAAEETVASTAPAAADPEDAAPEDAAVEDAAAEDEVPGLALESGGGAAPEGGAGSEVEESGAPAEEPAFSAAAVSGGQEAIPVKAALPSGMAPEGASAAPDGPL